MGTGRGPRNRRVASSATRVRLPRPPRVTRQNQFRLTSPPPELPWTCFADGVPVSIKPRLMTGALLFPQKNRDASTGIERYRKPKDAANRTTPGNGKGKTSVAPVRSPKNKICHSDPDLREAKESAVPAPNPTTASVILSEVSAPRCEALTQSKDPCRTSAADAAPGHPP